MELKSRFPARQTLLIDADDTLWENNIYFERAIAAFISCLDHKEYSPAEVRVQLNQVERETILSHGYGVSSFRQSLITCFERLSHEHFTESKRELVSSFAQSIIDQEIELLPDVAETLEELASRHRLILVTKGNQAEQIDKFQRSGLREHFTAIEIPREKDPQAYFAICAKHELSPNTTWMIGNSPRSDINPALLAGLHAVLVHHPHTWALEHEEIDEAPLGQHFLELTSFAALAEHF
ncbi:Hydrolase, haloacid delahogenase-like family [Acidisarcina polymorpha]|uniref:Hydrolase, haloacid delahogenase-like family n=1 Tax=Acidisarcina polymorpha TaxID=2211140 RepID=A0A2Z5G6X5_9BACT|nr:HAD-IA family hydrolase [Acidisarcina polymorpha]AXC14841.1 Hydrolase, haloacid delahogenase-like family [Acidisarcina polymorpha]